MKAAASTLVESRVSFGAGFRTEHAPERGGISTSFISIEAGTSAHNMPDPNRLSDVALAEPQPMTAVLELDPSSPRRDDEVRVLLVEDNPDDATLIEGRLRHDGLRARVRVVETREAFEEALAESAPDIVLCDFSLPRFDPLLALTLVRETDPDIPFILVTGTIGEDRAVEVMKAGAADIVLKDRLDRLGPATTREVTDSRHRRAGRWAEEEAARNRIQVARHSARLSGIIDAMPANIAMLDREGVIVGVNAGWRQFAEANALMNPHWAVGDSYLDACRCAMKAGDGLAGEALQGIEQVLARRRDRFDLDYPCSVAGREQWFRMIAAPAGGDLGAVIAHVDITESVVSERARSALKSQFEGVVDNVPGYVFRRVRTPAGQQHYGYVSASAGAVFGLAPERIVADPRSVWSRIEPDDLRLSEAAYERSARDLSEVAVEFRVRVADKGLRWLRSIAKPTREEDGTVNWDGVGIDITAQKSVEAQLDHLAHHDSLTGIANRRLFEDRVEQATLHAERTGQSIALHVLDIDHFKEINDTLGHAAGDELLRLVAERLGKVVRRSDTLARIGSDEFGILQFDLDSAHDAAILAEHVRDALADPFFVGGSLVRIGCTIGIDVHTAQDESDLGPRSAQLLARADIALFDAKKAGRGTYHFFAPELDVRARDRMQLRQALHQAIKDEEFRLLYQPQVDLGTGKIVGVEALIRWQSPTLGLVTPDRFIPLAEETGLIQPIGAWVLREACRQMKAWDDAGVRLATMAVNVSAEQLTDECFVATVKRTLAETELEPGRLDLEVTETSLMADSAILLDGLARLRAMGVNITIDDFGTGYSSFIYLKRLPAMKIKIDREFVSGSDQDGSDRALIEAMVAMASALKLDVVAEGIETEQQAETIRRLGCPKGQGFLFGRPVSAEDLSALLTASDGL